jgi:CoA:oxalate CoA-transferase
MSGPAPFPLAGIRVLDLSRAMSGPFVGRIMSDLGAEVVKVELPGTDITQAFGPRTHGHSGLYVQQNTGKRNISLDLTAPGGPALLTRLAERVDVVVENFRPGTLTRLAVDHAALSAANPGLIMLSVSGFGQWGPESHRQAYAPVVHAETGLLGRQAEVDGGQPKDLVLALADSVTALHGAIAVLAALRLREHTGTGQHIDLSMFESMLATDDYTHYSLEGNDIWPARGTVYEAVGGPLLVSGDAKYVWVRLRDGAGLRDRSEATGEDRIAARAELVREWVAAFTDRQELIAELERVGLAWAEVRTPSTVMLSPTAIDREVAAQVDDRAGGTRPVIRLPYRFSQASCAPRAGAAHVGEHNAEVLADWLGMTAADVGVLELAGVLRRQEEIA